MVAAAGGSNKTITYNGNFVYLKIFNKSELDHGEDSSPAWWDMPSAFSLATAPLLSPADCNSIIALADQYARSSSSGWSRDRGYVQATVDVEVTLRNVSACRFGFNVLL